jgi:cytochrome c oxidase subunit 4
MHTASWLRYVVVWIALVALAVLSFMLAKADLGKLDIVAALGIAFMKTALVVVFFMELIEHRFINWLVLLVAGGFIVLLLTLMVSDVVTRHTFPRGPVPAALLSE